LGWALRVAHDFAPALGTAGCDHDCSVVVGVPDETTAATVEFTLGAAISFLVAADGIGFRPAVNGRASAEKSW
jgi:hypothetical protein